MTEAPWELPVGWHWSKFGEVARVDSHLTDPLLTPDAPHIAPNHMESGTGVLLPYSTVAADGVTSAKHRFRVGHIVYSKIRPYLAKAVLVDFNGLCSADCYPISTSLNSHYLHRWLISPDFTARASGENGRTLLPKINREELSELPVPVPPPAEQTRIALRIEDLLGRARRAREALAPVPKLLQQLRQSVLAAAFRGELTAEWREAHSATEPASVLLDRIRAERRRRWEAAYPRKKYVAPEPVDVYAEDLPELPTGWLWASFSEVAQVDSNLVDPADYPDSPHVAPNHIEGGTGRLLPYSTVSMDRVTSAKHLFAPGHIIYSKIRPYLAKAAIVDVHGLCSADCYPVSTALRSDFLHLWMISPRFTAAASGSGTRTLLPKINQEELSRLPVPVAPVSEQKEVVRAIRAGLDAAERIALIERAASKDLNTFEQSVLSRAFRGELTP